MAPGLLLSFEAQLNLGGTLLARGGGGGGAHAVIWGGHGPEIPSPHGARSGTTMTENKKRNIIREGRVFNSKWTNKLLFTVVNSKVLRLVCRNVISVPKEYHLRRHFETQHSNLTEFDANEKRLNALNLQFVQFQSSLRTDQNYFRPSSNESATPTTVTVVTATKIQLLVVLASRYKRLRFFVFFTFPRSQDLLPLRW